VSKENINYEEYYKGFYKIWERSISDALEMWKKRPSQGGNEAGEKTQDFDSVTYYKKFYETWEKTTSEALEKWVNSPLFASNMGKIIEKSSELKKNFDEVVEKGLKNMNIPSKGDIDRILNSINKIEEKINDLTDMVDELKIANKKRSRK